MPSSLPNIVILPISWRLDTDHGPGDPSATDLGQIHKGKNRVL